MRDTFLVMPNTPAVLPSSAALTPTGLSLSRALSLADWEELGYALATVDEAMPWAWGDWLAARPKGQLDQDAVDISGKPWDTLRVWRWVAEKVAPVTRVTGLSWTHHRAVAELTKDEQIDFLALAVAGSFTKAQLEDAVRAYKKPMSESLADPVFTGGASNNHVTSEEVQYLSPESQRDAVADLEAEYGIERTTATPKNQVRATVKAAVGALTALQAAVADVGTWPPDLAAEFGPLWDLITALGRTYTERQAA